MHLLNRCCSNTGVLASHFCVDNNEMNNIIKSVDSPRLGRFIKRVREAIKNYGIDSFVTRSKSAFSPSPF